MTQLTKDYLEAIDDTLNQKHNHQFFDTVCPRIDIYEQDHSQFDDILESLGLNKNIGE